MVIKAGPAAKADARNLGPINGLFQKALAGSPWYRKAVTKWIAKAQNIERKTNGRYTFSFGF
jgi:hypothetical protein